MVIKEIKRRISELAKEHEAIDLPCLEEIKFAEMIESDAEALIIEYCEHKGYEVNGFPIEKRKLFEDGLNDEYDDDYFCHQRFKLYLDILAIEKEDVAELLWYYNNSFWPDYAEDKDEFLNKTKKDLDDGYYNVEL